jgi:hypothetical protein
MEEAWDETLMMEKFVEFFGDEHWRRTCPRLKNVVLSLCRFDDMYDDDPEMEWKPNGGEADLKELCTSNGLECEVIRRHTCSTQGS